MIRSAPFLGAALMIREISHVRRGGGGVGGEAGDAGHKIRIV